MARMQLIARSRQQSSLTENAGKAVIKGIELETTFLLPYAPHFSSRFVYSHTFELNDSDVVILRADTNFATHQYLDYHDYAAVAQGAYTRTGAALTWNPEADRRNYSAELFVRNLENQAILGGARGDNAAPGRNFQLYGKNGYYMAPRRYGIQFSAGF